MSNICITAFKWVPPFAQGLVRDLRVRWASRKPAFRTVKSFSGRANRNSPAHRAVQPFGQVPMYEEDGLTLFESGAIVMHIAEKSEVLLPRDPAQRSRARTWMFAALNSVEPHVQNLTTIDLFFQNEEWGEATPACSRDTRAVSPRGGSPPRWRAATYLEGSFTAGDLMMASVLRFLRHTSMVTDMPVLAAYQARVRARPAFARALAAQLAPFEKNQPKAA
jgi:glutathione S-transferase